MNGIDGSLRRWCGALVAASLLGAAAPALAQEPARGVYVVDSRSVIERSRAGQQLGQFLTLQRQDIEKSIGALEERVRTESERLENDKGLIDDAAYQERRKGLQDQVTQARETLTQRQREIVQFQREALGRVQESLAKALEEIVSGRGGGVALDKQVVFFSAVESDLTEAALKRLDTLLPNLEQ